MGSASRWSLTAKRTPAGMAGVCFMVWAAGWWRSVQLTALLRMAVRLDFGVGPATMPVATTMPVDVALVFVVVLVRTADRVCSQSLRQCRTRHL